MTWAVAQLRGVNVESITYDEDVIEANRASAVLKIIDAGGWQRNGRSTVGHYGGKRVVVAPAGQAWAWAAAGGSGNELTLTGAKRAAASALAAL